MRCARSKPETCYLPPRFMMGSKRQVNDQSRRGRFGGMTGTLLASCNDRESVCWRRPISNASCRALTEFMPISRATIFCLNARENGFVTESALSRQRINRASEATTILTL